MATLQLTLILSGRAFQELSFEPGDLPLGIGRSPSCAVHLDNLGISRRHAEIRSEGGLPVLHDLGSNNGVQVNGTRVKRHALNDGDLITVGKFTIAVKLDGLMAEAAAAEARTVTEGGPGGDLGQRTIAASAVALQAAQRAVETRAYLRDPKGEVTVLMKPVYLFGSTPECDFRVQAGGLLQRLFATPLVAALIREDAGFRALDLSPRGDVLKVRGGATLDARLGNEDELVVLDRRLVYHVGRPPGG